MRYIEIRDTGLEDFERLQTFADGCVVVACHASVLDVVDLNRVFTLTNAVPRAAGGQYRAGLIYIDSSGSTETVRTLARWWTIIEPEDEIPPRLREKLISLGYDSYDNTSGVNLFNKLVAHTRSS